MKHAPPSPRYALYYAPGEGTPWWVAWSSWIGRCAATGRTTSGFLGQRLARECTPGLDAGTLERLTADPRRYGFHATVKPPFRLAPHAPVQALEDAVERWSVRRQPIGLPAMHVHRMAPGEFLALVPDEVSPRVLEIAADCVQHFDRFRAPPSEAERARRLAQPLSPRERALLDRWGYPWVLERFRFHMSLTGVPRAGDDEAMRLLQHAACRLLAALGTVPPAFDAIVLFEQSSPQAPFRVRRRFDFGA